MEHPTRWRTRLAPWRSRLSRSRLARSGLTRSRLARTRLADDEGSATAEYAIATMAAVGFAGLLVVILRSNEVRAMLLDIIRNALSI